LRGRSCTHSFVLEDIIHRQLLRCQKSGDAITWVRDTEQLDFPEAVERLAQRAASRCATTIAASQGSITEDTPE